MPSTIPEALAAIRRLHDTDTGRIRGIQLRHHTPADAWPVTQLPEPLAALVRARSIGTITPQTPEYLVTSDRALVAWLTGHGRPIPASTALTRTQARHQHLAIAALSDLQRHVLRELADRRDALAGNNANARAEHDLPAGPGLRVAPGDDPTNTTWTAIGADLTQAAERLTHATRPLGTGTPLIVSARGYGRYGTHRHRLPLDVLCAMHAVAERHRVSVYAIGNWLDAEGATDMRVQLDASELPRIFADAYIGPFPDRRAYTARYMNEHDWTAGLQHLGVPDRYFDIRQLEHDLFSDEVRDVATGVTRGHIEVFRRAPNPQPRRPADSDATPQS